MSKGRGAAFAGGAGTVLLVCAVLFGRLGGGGDGLLPSHDGHAEPAPTQTEEVETVEPDATQEPALEPSISQDQIENSSEEAEDDGVLDITVRGSQILYRGETVNRDGLEHALAQDYTRDKIVTLIDDHAIKSVYDDVLSLLKKLDITPQ